jgi:DNA polymerase-3 subunit epsilon
MREIVLDTETTGLSPDDGHRLVDIACVELRHKVPVQRFQRFVNPERDVPPDAYHVHKLSTEFLAGFPPFAAIAEAFLAFIGDAPLVIHNAEFDMRFINAELVRAGFAPLAADRATCTVQMARRRHPGAPASLDALCRRFGIDNSHRVKHGAMVDADLLAEVYLELSGGRQPGFALAGDARAAPVQRVRVARPPRPHAPSAEELARHAAMVAQLKNPFWVTGDA